MIERTEIHLTSPEWDRFNHLRPLPGEAFDFWREVALSRGLDPKSVIGFDINRVTALPLLHGQHWCAPYPLQCKRRPRDVS